MTHLEEAIAAMERYEDLRNRDSSHAAEMALKARDAAAVWAAIAQAQALERIAEALEAANARDDVTESVAIYGS